MKILRLTDSLVSPACTNKHVDTTTNKCYSNLTHGTKGPATWMWFAGISPKHFPNNSGDELLLDGDNYSLVPVYKKSMLLRDKKDNICYNVTIDNDPTHKNDIILLWSIPGRTYADITFEVSGSVELLGEGVYGKSRGPNSITIPAPVLEIFGDCKLVWIGKDSNGHTVSQVVDYAYTESKWDIGSITTTTTKES